MKDRIKQSGLSASPPSPPAAPVAPPPPPATFLTESELMALAFSSIGEEALQLDLERIIIVATPSLFKTPAPPPLPERRSATPSPPSTHQAPLVEKSWAGAHWQQSLPVSHRMTLDPTLSPQERALLQRAEGQFIPVLRLRRLTSEDALHQLRLFVLAFSRQEHPFLRVVCGKGLESRRGPVLKPLVIHWCDNNQLLRGFAPEIDPLDGDFGSLILEVSH